MPEHDVGPGEQRVYLRVILGDPVGVEAAGVARREDLVVVPVVIDARRAFAERRLGVGDHGQFLVIDLHGGGGILGDILVFGQDRGERLAVPIHLVHRKRPVLPVVGGKGGEQHRNPLALHLRRERGAGDGAHHARHRQRRLEPDVSDPGMRMAGADEAEMQAVGDAHIGQEFAPAGEQAGILAALQRAADPACLAGRGHGPVSVSAGGASGFSP